MEEEKDIASGKFYETLVNINDQVSDIKTILICLVIFVVVQLLLYGGFLFYLLQVRPR